MKTNPLERRAPRRFDDASLTRTGVSRSFRIEIQLETRAVLEEVFACGIKLLPDSRQPAEASAPSAIYRRRLSSMQVKSEPSETDTNCSSPRPGRGDPADSVINPAPGEQGEVWKKHTLKPGVPQPIRTNAILPIFRAK